MSTNEDLGKLARDIWAEGADFAAWEDLSSEVRLRFTVMGVALYTAGFEAGADSVGVEL